MLEVRNVSKTYRAKSGVSVRALDRVSLTFPERGMVFLLGKSGSGKSTLLNVLGGLDTFDADGGEVIIKGKSSRDFRRSDFDAYRNTFVGFVFQEYNILDEFTVGANIALALQLQGKRADNTAINALLEQVDLAGYGHRKPNELSGGQKQRIAIARALIKNPEIIMADEPTGALDSATGEQVFETLKRLSSEKLVIVVSHDRDFAERFGDRIIELADGHVISDMTLTRGGSSAAGIVTVGEDMIRIRRGYTLTAEDLAMINAYLAKGDRDVILSKNEKLNGEVCAAAGISDEVGSTQQRPTGKVETRNYNPAETQFIRSHLPLRNAFKMGAGGMKHRPVRLIFTILLSFVAFALFGLADTMAAYDRNTTVIDSIADSSMQALAVGVKLRSEHLHYGANGQLKDKEVYYSQSAGLSDEDLRTLEARTGKKFYPVYSGTTSPYMIGLESTVADSSALRNRIGQTFWPEVGFGGFMELEEGLAAELGYTLLSGAYPTGTDELIITKYHYDMWKAGGMLCADGSRIAPEDMTETTILGKTVTVRIGNSGTRRNFRIVGVMDTHLSTAGYEALLPGYAGGEVRDRTVQTLTNRLNSEVSCSFHALFFGTKGLFDTFPRTVSSGGDSGFGIYYRPGDNASASLQETGDGNGRFSIGVNRVGSSAEAGQIEILWRDKNKTAMGADDLVLPLLSLENFPLDRFGITSHRGEAKTLIPALERYMSDKGIEYGSVFTNLTELLGEYNRLVTPKLSTDEFRALWATKLNERFGLVLTADDWEYGLTYAQASLNEEAAPQGTVTLTCWQNAQENFLPDVALDYFLYANEHYAEFAAKAKEASSAFRAFLQKYRTVLPLGGETGWRMLTDADAGYRGYLTASAALYLRAAEVGYYPAGEGDFRAASEAALGAVNEARRQAFMETLGLDDAPLTREELYAMLELYNQSENDRLRNMDWTIYSVLGGLFGWNDGTADFAFFARVMAALRYVSEHDTEVVRRLGDVDDLFTKYLIERLNSYEYTGDDKTPRLPGGTGEGDRPLRLYWAAIYLLDTDSKYEQYRGAFGVSADQLYTNFAEDWLAGHIDRIPALTVDLQIRRYLSEEKQDVIEPVAGATGLAVTGFYRSTAVSGGDNIIFSDGIYAVAKKAQEGETGNFGGFESDNGERWESVTGKHEGDRYVFALMPMKDVSHETLGTLTDMHYDETGEFGFRMTNDVVDTMDNWGEMIGTMRKTFLWIGLGFALFAALMMLNFVSATVTDKKREIGILRAVGARAADVFLIFFTEAFVVAMINFVLAGIATGVATVYINLALRQELGFSLTLLHFGLRQVGLIFAVSLAVALIGTLLPASKIARKTPVDAMRDK